MGKEVVKELLQYDLSKNICEELNRILCDANYRQAMLNNFTELRKRVGTSGASGRVGKRMVELLIESGDNKSGS